MFSASTKFISFMKQTKNITYHFFNLCTYAIILTNYCLVVKKYTSVSHVRVKQIKSLINDEFEYHHKITNIL